MPELKVFYYLFLLTLLDTTSPIRPSLHGHNNGEHFCLSVSLSFSLSSCLSLSLSLPVTISMLIEEIRLLSDDDNRRELQEPIILKASRRDATLAKKRDGKPSGFTHTRSPRDGFATKVTLRASFTRQALSRDPCVPASRASRRPMFFQFFREIIAIRTI